METTEIATSPRQSIKKIILHHRGNDRYQFHPKDLRNLGAGGSSIILPFSSAIWPLHKSDKSWKEDKRLNKLNQVIALFVVPVPNKDTF